MRKDFGFEYFFCLREFRKAGLADPENKSIWDNCQSYQVSKEHKSTYYHSKNNEISTKEM